MRLLERGRLLEEFAIWVSGQSTQSFHAKLVRFRSRHMQKEFQ